MRNTRLSTNQGWSIEPSSNLYSRCRVSKFNYNCFRFVRISSDHPLVYVGEREKLSRSRRHWCLSYRVFLLGGGGRGSFFAFPSVNGGSSGASVKWHYLAHAFFSMSFTGKEKENIRRICYSRQGIFLHIDCVPFWDAAPLPLERSPTEFSITASQKKNTLYSD